MLLKLGNFNLFSLLLDLLRFFLLVRVTIVKSVVRRISVDMITTLRCSFTVIVHLEVATLNLLSVHLDESLLGTLMSLKLDVCEALRLFRLPIVRDTNALDFAKATESITDIVLLESVWETLDEKSLAVAWHQSGHF